MLKRDVVFLEPFRVLIVWDVFRIVVGTFISSDVTADRGNTSVPVGFIQWYNSDQNG